MGKPDDSNNPARPRDEGIARPRDENNITEPTTEEDTEGHLFLPNDPSTARSMVGDRMRETEKRARDRGLERDARQHRQGRTR
ncbi:hypothetical protein BH23CHL7_BH23CHL7_16970 [soil metagenome]